MPSRGSVVAHCHRHFRFNDCFISVSPLSTLSPAGPPPPRSEKDTTAYSKSIESFLGPVEIIVFYGVWCRVASRVGESCKKINWCVVICFLRLMCFWAGSLDRIADLLHTFFKKPTIYNWVPIIYNRFFLYIKSSKKCQKFPPFSGFPPFYT